MQQQDFVKFYDSVIAYVDKWFDFSPENVMVKLKPIGLYEELSFTDLEQMVAALKMTETVSMDQLYEEFCASQEEIQKDGQDTTISTREIHLLYPSPCPHASANGPVPLPTEEPSNHNRPFTSIVDEGPRQPAATWLLPSALGSPSK
ncbi:hypothetical protein N1851_007153 [Merluccius polli]|uniref:Uncharacterized protein n=1 Tax=Merluccius polli TaxID=89951 RepID=A0AA47P8T8_MERPO|nr:hypothetical protein N1851_007153 [Merluccius polli]